MTRLKLTLLLHLSYLTVVLAFCLSINASAAQPDKLQPKKSAIENLSAELRSLLQQEMNALNGGIHTATSAYISGDFATVAAIAEKMQKSYLLEQQMTNQQMHEIHTSLPQAFLSADEKFHYLAGMLAHVASKKKPELVGFYLSKINEACFGCHAQFAKHRFPQFDQKTEKQEHHH